jgi:molybdopterin converting factor subunit 1
MKQIKMTYFAFFRDKANTSNEEIATQAQTAKELYKELKSKYDFELCSSKVKVAINDEFKDFDFPLNNGDKVVFIPPVAGG